MSHLIEQHWYTLGWLVLLAGFAVLETLAILDRDKGDTLSEHVWWLAGHPLTWLLLAAFLFWLVVHFLGFGKLW
jgi:hypothetical protein